MGLMMSFTRRFVVLLSLIVFGVMFFAVGAQAAGYVPGEALVVLSTKGKKVTVSSLQKGELNSLTTRVAASVGAKAVKTYSALSQARGEIFTLVRSTTLTTEELINRLKKDSNVVAVSPNYIVRASSRTPNDPEFSTLWGMKKIRADEAWDITTGSSNIHVAVMDSGIDTTHPDLAGNIDLTRSKNFTSETSIEDLDGHGTHVAGTIAAVGNNGVGVVGVNWTAKVISLKVLEGDGSGSTDFMISALDELVRLLNAEPNLHISAVNMSLGFWASQTPQQWMAAPLYKAFKTLDDLNRTVIVVAAGNETLKVGEPSPIQLSDPNSGAVVVDIGDYAYPASFVSLKNMVVVAASDSNGGAPEFTNWGDTHVHVHAPGVDIKSTFPLSVDVNNPSGYARLAGTSMAAPHVAGAVALLASQHTSASASALKSAILQGANLAMNPVTTSTVAPYYNSGATKISRYGFLDVRKSLDALSGGVKSWETTPKNVGVMLDGVFHAARRLPGDTLYLIALPYATPLNAVTISMTLPAGATISPSIAQTHDFSSTASQKFTITAEDGVSQEEIWIKVVADQNQGGGSSSSSGGCSTGTGLLSLILVTVGFVTMRKKR